MSEKIVLERGCDHTLTVNFDGSWDMHLDGSFAHFTPTPEQEDALLDLLIRRRCGDIRIEPSVSEGFFELIDQENKERRWASVAMGFESAGVKVSPWASMFGSHRDAKEMRKRAAYNIVAARWLEAQE